MKFKFFSKKYFFAGLVFVIVLANSFIFLPKYGSFNGASDVEYRILAENMLNGDGFSIGGEKTMLREPAYPFFLFLNYKIFGVNDNLIRAEQFVLLFLILYLVYILTLKIFNVFTARVSVLMIAGLPIFSIYAVDLISEIFSAFLILLFLFLFIKSFEKEKSFAFAGLSGLIFGILVLTKSAFILLPIFLAPIYFLAPNLVWGSGRNAAALKKSLVFLLVFVAVVSPWMLRNYANFGRVAVADRGGMLFYLHTIKSEFSGSQLKDYAVSAVLGEYFVKLKNPSFDIVVGEGIDLMNKKREGLINNGHTNAQADDIMASDAKKLFFEHPIKNAFIGFLEVVKVNAPMSPKYSIMFSFPDNIEGSSFERFARGAAIIIIRLIWLLILGLAAFGAYKAVKSKNMLAIPLIVFILYLNAVIFFLQGVPRFVFPIYPLYFIFTAFGARYIIKNLFMLKYNQYGKN